VSLKRWTKAIGDIVMVLIVLTDKDPFNATRTLMRKFGFVLIPLSIVLIKYYPNLSRSYNRWTYATLYSGVALTKNSLGVICLISGIYFLWEVLRTFRDKDASRNRIEILSYSLLLVMILWLLIIANCATCLICLIISSAVLVALDLPMIKKNLRYVGAFFCLAIVLLVLLQLSFDIGQVLITGFGRDLTLTERTPLWTELVDMVTNPLIGTGFESFWLGDRIKQIWGMDEFGYINQAHNGYLEIYLNLGWLGLFFLAAFLISTYRSIRKKIESHFDYGKLQFAFLITVLVYNISEATFSPLHPLWLVLLLIAIKNADSHRYYSLPKKDNSIIPRQD